MPDELQISTDPITVAECRRDRRGDVLAYAAVGLIFFVLIILSMLIILKITPDNALITLIVQVVTGVFGFGAIVYGFQFGSSQGSQAKTDHLANAIAPPPATPTKELTP